MRARFTPKQVREYLEIEKIKFHRAVVKELSKAGKEFVRLARGKRASEGGFNDVTGNLRSSIAFAVIYRGKIMASDYASNGTAEGKNQAKRLISEMKSQFSEGYALLAVAGMDYATKVESKGKDVISGSSLIVEEMLRTAIDRLKNDYK
ncbi:hypothetical protein D3C87_486180 [compost metagenome]